MESSSWLSQMTCVCAPVLGIWAYKAWVGVGGGHVRHYCCN